MKRALLFAGILTGLTACGGGGGGSAVPAPTSSTPTAPAKTQQVVGSTSLTIKFPTSFGIAKKASSAKSKQPAYVNPNLSNFIDVWVNQQLAATASVNSTSGDGTQTINVPLYSTQNSDILVLERDGSNNLLALGKASVGTFAPGQSPITQTSTLFMNLFGYAYSTDGSTATQISNGNTILLSGSFPGTGGNGFYVVPIDASGGFTLTSLAGSSDGLPQIQTSSSPNASGSNITQNPLGEYFANFDVAGDQTGTISFSAQNPAYNFYFQQLSSGDQTVINNYEFSYAPYFSSNPNVSASFCPSAICG